MRVERVQGRVYKDEWATCACSDVALGEDRARYLCSECDGRGKIDIDILDDAAYAKAKKTGRWTKRCGHCNGAGWHP